ncbi:hypothetical protein [Salidesulfovibrio onnuriiensis]|uniref:hypothetical protein n=1 Tax=Salidesulfovibrio onnuriiensis TaxID=2583823 RepID=UPI0011C83DB5|nr:hypothetical protein [Salidesulfovibrio onnuriiensis]
MPYRFLVFLFLLVAPVQAVADQTFRNEEYGYALTLPDEWEQLSEGVVAPFRTEHGHKERATHPMVAFYQPAANRRFFSPLILVNVGDYAEPMYLSRYDYREVAEMARKQRRKQARLLPIHGTPFIRVDAFPQKRLIREVFDISDRERVALYTYFSPDRYWEFVYVYPLDDPDSYAVRQALDRLVVERDEMRGFEALVLDTWERAKDQYGVFFEDWTSWRALLVAFGVVVLFIGLAMVYRWRESREKEDASGGQRE